MAVVRYETKTHFNGRQVNIGVALIRETQGHLTVTAEHPEKLRKLLQRRGIHYIVIESSGRGSDIFYQREHSNPRESIRTYELPTPLQPSGHLRLEVWRTNRHIESGNMLHVHETSPSRMLQTNARYRLLAY